MKTAVVHDYISGSDVEIDIHEKVGLKPGDSVRHKNTGTFGGATAKGRHTITSSIGHVVSVDFQGENHWGGQVYTAEVRWANGETYTCATSLLIKELSNENR